MVKVLVRFGPALEILGEFEFDQLPRVGETLNVASETDPFGFRAFMVNDVDHVAAGVGTLDHEYGPGPRTVLACDEII